MVTRKRVISSILQKILLERSGFVTTMYLHSLKILVLVTVLTSISCKWSSAEAVESPSMVAAVAPEEALTEAAALYKKRDDLENARKAIKILEKARNPEKRNYEVEWKYALYSYFVGSRKNVEDDEAETVLEKGINAARIAKRMKPDRPEGHFWYGAILGEQSKRSPVTVGVVSIKKIKAAMKKVIEIDPGYEGASAYDALGQVELSTRGLAGGSPEKALEHFEKAEKLAPDNTYAKLHKAQALLALNRDDEAKPILQKLLKVKPNPDFLPEHEEVQKDVERILDEKF